MSNNWNERAHRRVDEGRCPNCGRFSHDWLLDHGDGDDGFTCQYRPEDQDFLTVAKR